MRIARRLGLFTALAVLPSALQAEDSFSQQFELFGVVPTICRVDFGSASANIVDNTVMLGQMTELCNDVDGYRVVLRHTPGLGQSSFLLNGQTIPLSPSGETVIVDSNVAAWHVSDAKIQLAPGTTLDRISFQVEPKGQVY